MNLYSAFSMTQLDQMRFTIKKLINQNLKKMTEIRTNKNNIVN